MIPLPAYPFLLLPSGPACACLWPAAYRTATIVPEREFPAERLVRARVASALPRGRASLPCARA